MPVSLPGGRSVAFRSTIGIPWQNGQPNAAQRHSPNSQTDVRRWAKQVDANGQPRKRSWREDERQIDRYLLPRWQHRRVKEITRHDVRDLVESIAERRLRKGTTEDGRQRVGAPIMANRALALVKKIFNFALDREWVDANPAARLKPVAPERARESVLSPVEIRALWRQLDSEHFRIASLFRALLLTAQRSGEVSRMRWADLQPKLFERNEDGLSFMSEAESVVWRIPGTQAKNGRPHEVPLSWTVVKLLRDLAAWEEVERQKINAKYRAKKHQRPRQPSEYMFRHEVWTGQSARCRKRFSDFVPGATIPSMHMTCVARRPL